jgi:glycosyltransferase involved in cell wall biosynthesis
MNKFQPGEVHVAVVASPANPVSERGGSEVFAGALANELAEEGFGSVRVYGPGGSNFDFAEGVTYVSTGPLADELMAADKIGVRQAINETALIPSLKLADDIVHSPEGQRWAVIDNELTSIPLASVLAAKGYPHILIQHSRLTQNANKIYHMARGIGSKVVAIADYQRGHVDENFGPLHDTTIKNGVYDWGFNRAESRPIRDQGAPIRVGTLARIEPSDCKGIRIAARVIREVRKSADATLTIAGPSSGRDTFQAIAAPYLNNYITYAGTKNRKDKVTYLEGIDVGAAFSNPGGWNDEGFTGAFAEGNSLTLSEMMYGGVIPVSSDSGGAEPMVDAGLSEFVVPLEVIRTEGMDAFTAAAAAKVLKAADYLARVGLPELRGRVRTMEEVGRDYGEFIMNLMNAGS